MAGRPTKATKIKQQNLARARQILLEARQMPPERTSSRSVTPKNGEADNDGSGDEVECTGWTGGVSNYVSSDDEPIIISDDEEEEGVEELPEDELEEVVQKCLQTLEVASQPPTEPNMRPVIMRKRTEGDWRKAESRRSLGYNKQSGRTKRRHENLRGRKKRRMRSLERGKEDPDQSVLRVF